jgi:23S rRNA pseudouridine2605 synthase
MKRPDSRTKSGRAGRSRPGTGGRRGADGKPGAEPARPSPGKRKYRSKPRTDEKGGEKSARGRGTPAASAVTEAASPETGPMRLNRYIARAGVCARREADELIKAGLVKVDGAVVVDFSTKVDTSHRVEVNGKLVTPVEGLYLLLNKPSDSITTKSDEKGRKTVFDLVEMSEETKGALFPVGRLDRETTGVLLMTSDGDLAHRLMHPSFEVEKLYRIRTTRNVSEPELQRLVDGLELEDGVATADQVAYLKPGDKKEVGVAMHSGRNRIVRRMFEALGHDVQELERVRYAGLTSAGVRRGKWRRLTEKEVRRLYRAVKLKL